MQESPIIIGGNGHSGTRVFADVLLASGVYMGVRGISYAKESKDLNIRGLMARWIKPYLLGQSAADTERMQRQFRRRLRILIPFRSRPWGFKNPRSMFLLPFYHSMFPRMKFIHVIRDGRDMCFGNPFVQSPTYWSFVSEDEMRSLTPEEGMMRFWGEANRRVRDYGESELRDRYLRIRFEDICDRPTEEVARILEFAERPAGGLDEMAALVRKPKSIGRWSTFDPESVSRVVTLGREYLTEFGYE